MTDGARHVVVGSGAGGALTAALLAEAGEEVLVLEEGPWIEPDDVEAFSLDQMARQYRNGGVTAALGRPPVAYVEGRCAGGSTEVNAGLYHRTPESTLARWRETHRVRELHAADLEAHFEANERALSVQTLPGEAPAASRLLAEGAAAFGWPAPEVPRWYRYDGDTPRKQSMTQTLLPRATRAGARIETGARVQRLIVDGGTAAGVRTPEHTIRAEHVWVCAGAIGTPALLQRSGLRRGVGATLQMHPTVKLAARFDRPLDAAHDVPVHQVKPFGTTLSFGGSVSRPGQVALALAEDWEANREAAATWEHMAVYYAAIRPEGRGRVIAVPGLDDPVVLFVLTRRDRMLLGQGLRHLAKLAFAAGAQSVHPALRGAGVLTHPDQADRLDGAVGADASVMTIHLCSTVPLGEDPRCVVDSFGTFRDVRGVQVNDASLLPSAPGVNPQGSVMALAARNVAAFLDR